LLDASRMATERFSATRSEKPFCTNMTIHRFAPLVLVLGACIDTGDTDDPDCSNGHCDVSQTCSDTRYDDGQCDLQLDCETPDIDCFRTFESDADAATWWTEFAKANGHPEHPLVPETDPRFQRVRKLLDDGWQAFRANRSVGKLAGARPALVVIDMPLSHAAFVAGDPAAGNQPFSVQVETASLDSSAGDDALLAVMMHELQHAVGLHLLGDNRTRLRKFYVAPEGSEPEGRDQPEDANAKQLGLAWIGAAEQVGPLSGEDLGGLPLGGELAGLFQTVVAGAAQAHPELCTNAVNQLDALQTAITGAQAPLDGSLQSSSDRARQVAAALAVLQSECLASFPLGVIEVSAQLAMTTPDQIEAQMDPHDVALVKGKPFVAGLSALVADRRATMRATEDMLYTSAYQPWSQLRYFSFEEDADNVSVDVMQAAGKDPASLQQFFHALVPPAVSAACDEVLSTTGLPPYGVDLADAHHAVCWRMGHVQRQSTAAAAARTAPPIATAPVTVRIPSRIPLPRKPVVILD
jgi:hypothetical protein